MTALLIALLVVGGVVSLVGSVMFLVEAFREGLGWGLAVMFIPFASLVFAFQFWDRAKRPTLISLGGTALVILAVLIMPRDNKPEPAAAAAQVRAAPPVEASAASPLLINSEVEYPASPSNVTHTEQVTETANEEPKPILAQVYADSATRLYYAADCAKRPENAFRIPKQIAERQGYTAADCTAR